MTIDYQPADVVDSGLDAVSVTGFLRGVILGFQDQLRRIVRIILMIAALRDVFRLGLNGLPTV